MARRHRIRALVGHLVVACVVAVLVGLGQWQLARLAEVQAANTLVHERMAAEVVDLGALVGNELDDLLALTSAQPPPDTQRLAQFAHRRIEVTGTYEPGGEVLHRNREHLGRSGFHLLTPLRIDLSDWPAAARASVGPGTTTITVFVRRGWVPADRSEPPVADAMPPAEPVTLQGILELPVTQPSFGPRDADEGRLARVFHADTARLAGQVDGDVLPLVIRLQHPDGRTAAQQAELTGSLPEPIGLPVLDEANHRSYAVQWHLFAVLALVTYLVWLSRQRRSTQPRSTA